MFTSRVELDQTGKRSRVTDYDRVFLPIPPLARGMYITMIFPGPNFVYRNLVFPLSTSYFVCVGVGACYAERQCEAGLMCEAGLVCEAGVVGKTR